MLLLSNVLILLSFVVFSTFIRITLTQNGTQLEITNPISINYTHNYDNLPLSGRSAIDVEQIKEDIISTQTLETFEAADAAPMTDKGKLPEFPQRPDAVYFIVAVAGGAKLWGRTLARALLDMGSPFNSPQGPPLRPLYIDIPQNGRFSAKVLLTLCQKSDGQPLAGVIVIGEGHSARAIAMAATSMGLPILWAKGGTANMDGMHREIPTPLQVMLQPSAKEILESIRALFLETHWHTFFVLSDVGASMVMAGNEGSPLKKPPLVPTILPISANDVFKQLAIISRNTRGVVLLLCDLKASRTIMAEAQNLNMVGGHFIWIWADTSSTTEFFEAYREQSAYNTRDDAFDATFLDKALSGDKNGESVRYHMEDLLDRKLDFEDLYPTRKHGSRNANKQQKSNKNQPATPVRYILGLDKDTTDISNERPAGQLRKRNGELTVPITDDNSDESLPRSLLNSKFTDTLLEPYNIYDNEDNKYEGKNRRTKHNQNSNGQYDHHFINTTVTSANHVLFHHFKDFPVGLLALRPIRMKVDRHFIRSAIRIFASTWAKIELETKEKEIRFMQHKVGKFEPPSRRKAISPKKKRSTTSNVSSIKTVPKKLQESNVNSESSSQVNSNFLNSSDLSNNKIKNINSIDRINQTLSGLKNKQSNNNNSSSINRNINNYMNNKSNNNTKVKTHEIEKNILLTKRFSAWWSTNNNNYDRFERPTIKTEDEHSDIRFNNKGTPHYEGGCYGNPSSEDLLKAEYFARSLMEASQLALSGQKLMDGTIEKPLTTHFELLNLVPDHTKPTKSFYNEQQYDDTENHPFEDDNNNPSKWRRVGTVSGRNVHLDTIVWPGGDIVVSGLSARARSVFRIVTALAPPFVMESELDEDGLCLRGLPCHRLSPSGRHNLTLMFNAIETRDRLEEDAVEHGNELPPEGEQDEKVAHKTKCCYGLSMDILDNVATELRFEFHLYIVRDELFGAKYRNFKDWTKNSKKNSEYTTNRQQSHGDTADRKFHTNKKNRKGHPKHMNYGDDQWNGIIGDLVSGSADMSFAPLSVSKARAEVIDFTAPYFHSGVSLLAAPKTKSEIPLLAFLLPFSPELWIAIFTSLNITAVAVAVYEWLSPFGLNPWGRQRSKNFSMSSALWVMWGLLCGHLVAFKAPKSWPNKFLINVWGGFSVIFVASYTANIAALIAGLFFHNAASNYDASLFTQRVGTPVSTASEAYVQNKDKHLWEHMKKYSLEHIEDGIRGLKNRSLDLLMADSPVLDYYRATDHGCSLQRIGETFVDDSYAIGMAKGFPLKDSISALISKYSSNGYLDILTEKWYGGLPCFKFEADIVQPRPLDFDAVAGVFCLLGLGMFLGIVILVFEHWFYKYALPSLRLKPKGTVWKSRNIMFFSQKLYRFINCVELVSPHHAARELVHSIRQGQIASLFQKSIKRKEDEQRRRRKSKAQFFEMIQEIRRVQQNEREAPKLGVVTEDNTVSVIETHKTPPPTVAIKPRSSPRQKLFSALRGDGRSRSNSSVLSIRRFSSDSIFGERMDNIGRRLSRDISYSPPDLGHHFETFGKGTDTSKFDTFSGSKSNENIDRSKFDTFGGAKTSNMPELPKNKKHKNKRPSLHFDSYLRKTNADGEKERPVESYELPVVKEGLEPPIYQEDRSKAVLKDKLHRELRAKYGPKVVITSAVENIDEIKVNENLKSKYSPINHIDRPAIPSPRHNQLHQNNSPTIVGSILKTHNTKNRHKKMSFERLSREDLLRLSHNSQSEIHDYLNSSSKFDRQTSDPP